MQRRVFLFGLAGVALAGGLTVQGVRADDKGDRLERARRAVESGRIKPLADIVAHAEREFDARVLDVEFEAGHRDDEFIYEVKLLARDGRIVVAIYDAATGQLIKTRGQRKK